MLVCIHDYNICSPARFWGKCENVESKELYTKGHRYCKQLGLRNSSELKTTSDSWDMQCQINYSCPLSIQVIFDWSCHSQTLTVLMSPWYSCHGHWKQPMLAIWSLSLGDGKHCVAYQVVWTRCQQPCDRMKFSSSHFLPYINLLPVSLWCVKSLRTLRTKVFFSII